MGIFGKKLSDAADKRLDLIKRTCGQPYSSVNLKADSLTQVIAPPKGVVAKLFYEFWEVYASDYGYIVVYAEAGEDQKYCPLAAECLKGSPDQPGGDIIEDGQEVRKRNGFIITWDKDKKVIIRQG